MFSPCNALSPPSVRSVRVAAVVAASGGTALLGAGLLTAVRARQLRPAEPAAESRTALVLGCPVGPALRARVQAAAALWSLFELERVVISGAGEAEAGAEMALNAGIDPRAIVLERHARNTRENVLLSRPLLDKNVVFVTDRLHLPRALRWGRRCGLQPLSWPVDRDTTRPVRAVVREAFAVIAELSAPY